MSDFLKDFLIGQLRHAVTIAGSALATRGIMDADDAQQLCGAVITILALAWSALDKYLKDRAAKPAVANSILEKL